MKQYIPFCALACTLGSSTAFSNPKLEETIVIASKTEMPLRQVGASVSVITETDLELSGYSNIVDALRSQPGISASNSGGLGKVTTVSIRGEQGYRTLVTIDGVEISDPSATQVAPQMQHLNNSNDIERVEILRGPQGFIYGADAGGVINIYTKDTTNGFEGQVSTSYGRYATLDQNAYVSVGNDMVQGFLSGSKLTSDGFNSRADDTSGEEDSYDNETIHGKFVVNAGESLKAKFVIRNTDAFLEYDNCGFSSYIADCEQSFNQKTMRFSIDHELDQIQNSVGFSRTEIEREFFTNGSAGYASGGEIQKADWLGSFSINDSLKLLVGSELKTEEIEPRGGNKADRGQKAFLTEVQTTPVDNLSANAGFRYDDNDDFGQHLSARLSGAYVFNISQTNTIKFRGSLGNGFRAPSLSEVAYNEGPYAFGDAAETELVEEQSSGVDLGADFFFGAHLISVTAFKQTIEDEIFYDLVGYSGYLQEGGESSSQGIEIGYDLPFHTLFNLKGNITTIETEDTEGEQRVRKPENIVNFGVQSKLMDEKFRSLLNVRHVSGNKDIGGADLDDYSVVDLSVLADVNQYFSVNFRAENLLNEDYEEITGFNTTGSAYYAGATFKF